VDAGAAIAAGAAEKMKVVVRANIAITGTVRLRNGRTGSLLGFPHAGAALEMIIVFLLAISTCWVRPVNVSVVHPVCLILGCPPLLVGVGPTLCSATSAGAIAAG